MSQSGEFAIQNYTVYTIYGIEWHIAMAKKINQAPLLMTDIEPWVLEVAFAVEEPSNSTTEGEDVQATEEVEEPIAAEEPVEEVE